MPLAAVNEEAGLTQGSPAVEVRELTKRYGEHLAVDGISFTVKRGEVVALLGPNGAGKSTTMRILACFMPATSGDATVAGYDIWGDSLEVRRRLGYMPENVPLYPEMRVREYLDYRARLKGVPPSRRRARVGEVAERCWVKDVLGRIIGQLSKGYRQRVGLAECLIHDPEILILDEPTIGLDPAQIRETRKLVAEIGRERTVILSTHILPEAEMVSSRVLIIHQGRLVPEEEIARMRAESAVVVEASGDAGRIEKALRAVKGVTKVRRAEAAARGSAASVDRQAHRFEVEGKSSPETRERISRSVLDAGGNLRELRAARADLEEIFVRITARDRSG